MGTKLVLENLQRYTNELEDQHSNKTAYWHLQKLRNEIERVKNIAYEPVLATGRKCIHAICSKEDCPFVMNDEIECPLH